MSYISFENNDIFIKQIEGNSIVLIHTAYKKYNYKRLIEFLDKQDISTICVIIRNEGFNYLKSLIISNLYHLLNGTKLEIKPSFDLCKPSNSITETPDMIPVSLKEDKTSWKENDFICVLPGWDFYEVEWILTRWESSLVNFDTNSFLPKPTYPKDLYNNFINPSIVLNTITMYVHKYSLEDLEKNFYGLYCFYYSKMGNLLLNFFYEESQKNSTNMEIYEKLKVINKSVPKNDPYRIFLFYKNNSVLVENKKKKFSINIFINQYLSFYGMFVCSKFVNDNIDEIYESLRYTNISLYATLYKNSVKKKKDLKYFLNSLPYKGWISRKHLENEKNYFWKYIYNNWDNIDRNIFLWHNKSLQYNDSQMKIGSSFLKFFSDNQIYNFETSY